MQVQKFVEIIGAEFYAGVPDSQLKALCNYLINTYGIDSRHHVIAANEGNAAALAAGYHLATGKVPVVYMQNSGEGKYYQSGGITFKRQSVCNSDDFCCGLERRTGGFMTSRSTFIRVK